MFFLYPPLPLFSFSNITYRGLFYLEFGAKWSFYKISGEYNFSRIILKKLYNSGFQMRAALGVNHCIGKRCSSHFKGGWQLQYLLKCWLTPNIGHGCHPEAKDTH